MTVIRGMTQHIESQMMQKLEAVFEGYITMLSIRNEGIKWDMDRLEDYLNK